MGNKKTTENQETKPKNDQGDVYEDGKAAVTKAGKDGKLYLVTNGKQDSPDLYVIAASQNSAIATVSVQIYGYQAKIMTKSDKLAVVLS